MGGSASAADLRPKNRVFDIHIHEALKPEPIMVGAQGAVKS